MPSSTGLTGAAGEYHVAAELSRRDWLATVTIKNAPGTDILAQRRDRHTVIAIQTKTASPGSAFQLSVKDETPGDRDNEWYVLVSLGELLARPSFFILPRHVLAAITFLQHRDWLRDMGRVHRTPQRAARTDNPRRSIRPRWIEGYLERWDLLDNSAWAAPFLGDPIFLELARDVPLPRNYRPLNPAAQ